MCGRGMEARQNTHFCSIDEWLDAIPRMLWLCDSAAKMFDCSVMSRRLHRVSENNSFVNNALTTRFSTRERSICEEDQGVIKMSMKKTGTGMHREHSDAITVQYK